MGIEVQVWSEALLMGWKDAEPPEIGEGGRTFETLYGPAKRAGEEFELLDYVDPYGETVFNQTQIETVLEDIRRLRPYARTPIDERTYSRLVDLAEKVKREVHTYLVFIGD
jgi:hypothetical protein